MLRILALAIFIISAAARGDEFRADFVRRSLTATYTHSQQYIGGIPVIGGERIERDGVRIAERRARQGFEPPVRDAVYVNAGGVARLARREITGGRLRTEKYYDVSTGELLLTVPLYFNAAARVFDPNPVAKLNDPSLQDRNDAAGAVPSNAYALVDLAGLAPSGPLSGPNVRIVDTDAPFTVRAEASQSLLFDRSQPQFEEVNAYFHIDRAQRYLQSLGYFGPRQIVNYALPVDAHAVDGTDNSYFATGDIPGEGFLVLGDGGTDDAEDSDIMIHEYAHAMHESIAPGAFSGESGSQARALAEGFGDYWAFSAKYAATAASGRDPFCLGDWDARCWEDDRDQKCGYPAGSGCLRRVDGTKTMAGFRAIDTPGIEHENGEIWSSALRDIFLGIVARDGVEQGKRLADTIAVEGLFGTPANPTFAGQAQRLLEADLALEGGANQDVICRAMASRGILTCGAPRGESTMFASATSVIRVSDGRPVADIAVRVETDGGSGRVTLIAPDGTSILLTSAPPLDATYGTNAVPAESLMPLLGRSEAGDWKLTVEGAQLRSWTLILRFEGDAPFASRPTTTAIRKHIPAIAHTTGVGGTLFASDVRVYNRSEATAALTMIFGGADFRAMQLAVEPHQAVVLEDIVQSVFQTSGIGQLELQGDVDRVIVNSRTYARTDTGTYGETIPSFETTEANADQIALLRNTPDFRSNVGIAEIGGGSGVVRFTFFDDAGREAGSSDVTLTPYEQTQFRVPVAGGLLRAQVTVVSGAVRFLAYGSVVDNRTGDAITIPADRVPQPDETVAIPTIHSEGVAGSHWNTEVYRVNPDGTLNAITNIGPVFGAVILEADGALLSSRTYTTSANGTYGQFIPALHLPSATGQELVGIEETARFRTNIGLMNFGDAATDATIVLYDASGAEVGRAVETVPGRSLRQVPVAVIVHGRVARAEVRGMVAAYASVVDNRTQDPSYIVGQY